MAPVHPIEQVLAALNAGEPKDTPQRPPARGKSPQPSDSIPIGLRMTPAERLRWLEETMETLRRWQGRARRPPPER